MYKQNPTWFNSSHDSSAGFEYSVVYHSLFISKFTISWEWTCNVTGVAVILSAHVKQTKKKRKESHWNLKSNQIIILRM